MVYRMTHTAPTLECFYLLLYRRLFVSGNHVSYPIGILSQTADTERTDCYPSTLQPHKYALNGSECLARRDGDTGQFE